METQADTIIGTDVQVKGNLKNKGSIQINGTVEGEVKSDENVTIGESATVTGPIVATNVLISGQANGTVEAKDKLEIDPTGSIDGEIKAKTLIVREGATFNGSCIMAEEKKTLTELKTDGLKQENSVENKDKEEKNDDKKGSFWDKAKK